MTSIRLYRIYDIGRDIDLARLETALADGYAATRAGFVRVKPKSIVMGVPPLQLRLDPVTVTYGGRGHVMTPAVRIYDIGAISLCFILDEPERAPGWLEETGMLFSGQEGLSEAFDACCVSVVAVLRPYLSYLVLDPTFFEDYTIYITDRIDMPPDPVPLLVGERTPLSPAMREEVLKNSLSYGTDDRVILAWDAALIAGPEPAADILDLIEFANVQVFELRYYDRELARNMEKMYDDIEFADRLPRFRRMRRYHALMTDIMQTHAEISEVIEKVNNLIKVTEDVYYARVYEAALRVFRSGQWSESVTRKIEIIRENYSMLSDEVRIQHSNFLEWIIIILIALEFGFAIWEFLAGSGLPV
ncbi:MAG: hypothetical protein GKC04_03890 [Methanomicrobiales archaeon]|nr:hypothetical protein [Methanomicrobiales archaeon]